MMLADHRSELEALRPPVSEIERAAQHYFDRLLKATGHNLRVNARYVP